MGFAEVRLTSTSAHSDLTRPLTVCIKVQITTAQKTLATTLNNLATGWKHPSNQPEHP